MRAGRLPYAAMHLSRGFHLTNVEPSGNIVLASSVEAYAVQSRVIGVIETFPFRTA